MLKRITFDSINSEKKKDQSHTSQSKNLDGSFDFLSLIRAWKDIAGQKLAEHTIPLKNQNGTLIVLSNHSAFANQLSFMELPLKKKIFEKFPNLEKSILNIKFVVDSTYFDTQYEQFVTSLEKKKNRELHPFSPEFRKRKREAEEHFSEIIDLELKEKLISIYIQNGL